MCNEYDCSTYARTVRYRCVAFANRRSLAVLQRRQSSLVHITRYAEVFVFVSHHLSSSTVTSNVPRQPTCSIATVISLWLGVHVGATRTQWATANNCVKTTTALLDAIATRITKAAVRFYSNLFIF